MAFDDIQPDYPGRPNRITVTDGTTGAVVDPYNLASYSLATANSTESVIADLRRNAYLTAGRDFRGAVPFSMKTGLNWLVSQRDNAFNQPTYNFVGADGRASTTPVGNDDSAARFLDPSLSQETAPFGFPLTQRIGNDGLYQFFQATPAQFTTNAATTYISNVNNSRFAREMITAGFVRGDVSFLANRLKLVGGLRAEQTNLDGEGPLNDPTRNYQRDAAGKILLGTNGRPLAITSDALASAQLTRVFRGSQAKKEYLTLFPSLNASYTLRENLTARAAYYHSNGRPNFDLYTGGVTLPDTESPASPTNVTTVANIAIKPWLARTKMVRLEYYFSGVGVLSASAFGETAREDDRLQGDVYTHFLIEGIKSGDLDGDGAVTLTEADDYARNTVSAYRNDLSQLVEWLKQRQPTIAVWPEVSTEVLREFSGYMYTLQVVKGAGAVKPVAPSTVARKIAAVRA
ncbi:MAG: TonB-dependent receptor, partial [bacterium]